MKTCWVNFDPSGVLTINDSSGIDSIIDNGTGDFTINFSSPFPNTNYLELYNSSRFATARGTAHVGVKLNDAATYKTTSSVTITVYLSNSSGSNALIYDTQSVSCLFAG